VANVNAPAKEITPFLGQAAFIFDLDGTLVDSVYDHVFAWHEALEACGFELSFWRIHRKIGMSEGLLTNMLFRELGIEIRRHQVERLRRANAQAYLKRTERIRPLPGALDLLSYLSCTGIPWAIASSGRKETAEPILRLLGVNPAAATVVTRDMVAHGKPEPDLFLAAAKALHNRPEATVVVGDSIWDMFAARRAGALGIGLLSGGFGKDELISVGACYVCEDPADLLKRIDGIFKANPRARAV
jgi:HAD superfamily hydrolase (TIGR01509 family)